MTILWGKPYGKIAWHHDEKKVSHLLFFYKGRLCWNHIHTNFNLLSLLLLHTSKCNTSFSFLYKKFLSFHIFIAILSWWAKERKYYFWKRHLITNLVEAGHVAQRIKACGYKPQCQGFESFLTHSFWGCKIRYFPN